MKPTIQACVVIAVISLAFPAALGAQYLGVARCRPCHLVQTKAWEQSKLAKTFELLKPGVAAKAKAAHKLDPAKDYTHDASCLPCHVTGYGKPGGFESIEKTPGLAGVQCEVCHGPGAGFLKPNLMSLQNKEYKRAELVAAGLTMADEKLCVSCHNVKSPFFERFDYAARKKGVHEHFPLKFAH